MRKSLNLVLGNLGVKVGSTLNFQVVFTTLTVRDALQEANCCAVNDTLSDQDN